MKWRIFMSLAILLAIWIGYRSYRMATTRSHSPAETINYSYRDLDINVTYSRPYKKGRVIFGQAKDRAWLPKGKLWTYGFRAFTGLPRTTGALVPYGKYWRLGANDATEISVNKNIDFAGKPVHAGRYRMYAVPNQDAWLVTLNSELGKFGLYEPDHSLDVVTVEIPIEPAPPGTEQFTINFDNDSSGFQMKFIWDKILVRVPLRIQ